MDDTIQAGVGYGYNNTKVDSEHGDTDVNGHALFLYGKYQPNDAFVRGVVNYGYARYHEKQYVGSIKMTPHYNVQNIGMQAMAGYDMKNGFIPEAELRYIRVMQDDYSDAAGQRIKAKANDALTLAADVKYVADTVESNEWQLMPNASFGLTYDLISDNGVTDVTVAGTTYRVNSKRLNRIGAEAGVDLDAKRGEWTFSVGYDVNMHTHYQSHTGMLKAKMDF